MNSNFIISVNSFKVSVNLGASQEERKLPQDVLISIKLYFNEAPKACFSDELEDTICYFKICETIKKYCADKEFKLLEYLNFSLYKQIRNNIDDNIKIWIKTEKAKPPIENLIGTTSFEYSDLENF